jgi:tetratricopeptide (TPR) repeat protein
MRPEFPDYYYLAGCIFSIRNRADLAENYFKKAISLNSKEVNYYIELGALLYQGKKFHEADVTLDEALKLDPNNMKAYFYKGKVLKDSKKFKEALPFLQKASQDQEFKQRALIETGTCYMSLKMIDKAIPELERAVKVSEGEGESDSLYARYFLGVCYEKNQDFSNAVDQWGKIYAKKKNFRDVGEKLIQYEQYSQSGGEPRS